MPSILSPLWVRLFTPANASPAWRLMMASTTRNMPSWCASDTISSISRSSSGLPSAYTASLRNSESIRRVLSPANAMNRAIPVALMVKPLNAARSRIQRSRSARLGAAYRSTSATAANGFRLGLVSRNIA